MRYCQFRKPTRLRNFSTVPFPPILRFFFIAAYVRKRIKKILQTFVKAVDICEQLCYNSNRKEVMKMVYGYARVSTKEQNLDRQIEQLRKYVSEERNIITDKQSGKDFNRKGYNSLVGTPETTSILHEGDLLVICSLDRLGRNYTEIREQWELITRELKADIKVLDMPLLDTTESEGSSLDKRFVADLVLQILSYVAEKERDSLLKRQRQGIDVMPIVNGKRMSLKKGKGAMGRPNAVYPENWEPVYEEWKSGKITAVKAMELLGLKRTTFYKLAKNYKK